MVGLSVLLEAQKGFHRNPQVINKTTMIKPYMSSSSSPRPVTSFLDECFMCKHRLFPGSDIYMYHGDRAFCSVECRNRQIMMEEEEKHVHVHDQHHCTSTETKTRCRRVASQFYPLFSL